MGMAYKMKQRGKAASMAVGLAMGFGISWAVTLLLAVMATFLIAGERVGESFLPSVAVGAVMVSAFVGAMVSAAKIGSRRLIVCLISGGIYYVSLVVCNGLLFDGAYQGLVAALLSILGCCLLAALLGLRRKSGKFKGFRGGYKGRMCNMHK